MMQITKEVYNQIVASLQIARVGALLATANVHTRNLFQRLDPVGQRMKTIGDNDLDFLAAEYQQIPVPEQRQVKAAVESRHMELGLALSRRQVGGQPVSHWHTNALTQIVNGVTYPWNVAFKLEENPLVKNELYLDVNVRLTQSPTWAITAQDFQRQMITLKGDFANRIVDAWSGRFAIRYNAPPPAVSFTRIIKVRIESVDAASTPANRRYDVRVVAPAQSIDTSASFTADERKKAMSSLLSDPTVRAAKRKVSSHLDALTLDMGTWGAGDPKAIVHEFGHMVGCSDEYGCTSFTPTAIGGRTYGLTYDTRWNVPGYSNDSIMNDPGQDGKVYDRHLTYVRHVYEAWKGVAQNTYQIVNARG
jgi:hypothetical protein